MRKVYFYKSKKNSFYILSGSRVLATRDMDSFQKLSYKMVKKYDFKSINISVDLYRKLEHEYMCILNDLKAKNILMSKMNKFKQGHILGDKPRGVKIRKNTRAESDVIKRRYSIINKHLSRHSAPMYKAKIVDKIFTKEGFNEVFHKMKFLSPSDFFNYLHGNKNHILLGKLIKKLPSEMGLYAKYLNFYVGVNYDETYPYYGRGLKNKVKKENRKVIIYNKQCECIESFEVDSYRGDYIRRNINNSKILSRIFKIKKLKQIA